MREQPHLEGPGGAEEELEGEELVGEELEGEELEGLEPEPEVVVPPPGTWPSPLATSWRAPPPSFSTVSLGTCPAPVELEAGVEAKDRSPVRAPSPVRQLPCCQPSFELRAPASSFLSYARR